MKQNKKLEAHVGECLESSFLYNLRYGGMPSNDTFSIIFEDTTPFISRTYQLYFPSGTKFVPIEQLQTLFVVKKVNPTYIALEERVTDVWPPEELGQD